MNAREAAKAVLVPLVRRGDTLSQICAYSRVTSCALLYTAQIGGSVYYRDQIHRIPQEQIVIKELAGVMCLHRFLVADLVAEIRSGEALPAAILLRLGRQLLLWDLEEAP